MPPATPPIWSATEEQKKSHPLYAFMRLAKKRLGLDLHTYDDVHKFSVDDLQRFWDLVWDFTQIRGKKFDEVISDVHALPADLPHWFIGAQFSFAENILFPKSHIDDDGRPVCPEPKPDHCALLEIPEQGGLPESPAGLPTRRITWAQLRQRVAVLTEVFRRKGIKAGDRVASVSSNTSQPIVTLLALNSIGAVYALIATDSGPDAIYSRLSQIRPKLITTDDVVTYNGKTVNIQSRVQAVAEKLKREGKLDSPEDFEVIIYRNDRSPKDKAPQWTSSAVKGIAYDDLLGRLSMSTEDVYPLHFQKFGAMHPVQIFFSSGSTGEPKCMMQGQTMLINMKKEAILCYALRKGDSWLQITTCGWIMWAYHLHALGVGGTAVLFDGAPLYPNPAHIPKLVAEHRLTGFGASPRFLSELAKHCASSGLRLKEQLDFSHMRQMTSTGAPLSVENAKFFYDAFPSHVHLASMSGGTDLAGIITGPSALVPLYGHLMQTKTIGIALEIWDPETGENVESTGQAGELVITKPFPTQPLYFFGPEDHKKAMEAKYQESYFERFPGRKVWAQGDFIVKDVASGGYEIVGRSDGVLNPSGVRFGSAEIYNVVEKFAYVSDSVCVGQKRPGKDADERVLLFVVMKAGENLTEDKIEEMKSAIAKAHSKRHVPSYIFAVGAIPVTLTGKKTEIAIKSVVCGQAAFKPSSATANPEALDEYRQYADLEAVLRKRGARL